MGGGRTSWLRKKGEISRRHRTPKLPPPPASLTFAPRLLRGRGRGGSAWLRPRTCTAPPPPPRPAPAPPPTRRWAAATWWVRSGRSVRSLRTDCEMLVGPFQLWVPRCSQLRLRSEVPHRASHGTAPGMKEPWMDVGAPVVS